MTKIYLSGNAGKGKFCFVDEDDLNLLESHKWHLTSDGYARTRIGKDFFLMHRFLFGSECEGLEVDHINGDKLDNRRSNLRTCTLQENMMNRGPGRNNSSGFRGVHEVRRVKSKRWAATINKNGKKVHLGYFPNAKRAALAYNEAAKYLHKEFAYLNDI